MTPRWRWERGQWSFADVWKRGHFAWEYSGMAFADAARRLALNAATRRWQVDSGRSGAYN